MGDRNDYLIEIIILDKLFGNYSDESLQFAILYMIIISLTENDLKHRIDINTPV